MKDITLIGAGPAGSAAALLLARRGWNVTLIEQHRFPRDKVCGECVSALGVEVLERLSLARELRNAGAIALNRAIIHGAEGQSITTPLPRPMMGISRQVMDALLLDAARNAGAVVRQPVRCEGIFAGGEGIVPGKSAARHPAPSPPYSGERAGVRGDLSRNGALPQAARFPLTPALSPAYRGEGAGSFQPAHSRSDAIQRHQLASEGRVDKGVGDSHPPRLRSDALDGRGRFPGDGVEGVGDSNPPRSCSDALDKPGRFPGDGLEGDGDTQLSGNDGSTRHGLSLADGRASASDAQPAHLRTDAPDRRVLTIRLRDLEQNKIESLPASMVILADGKAALAGDSPTLTGDMGIKTHWIDVDGPRDAIELFGCRGCYGGLAAIEGNRWNSAFSVPASRLRDHRGDIDSLLAELMKENDGLARRLSGAKRISPWLAAPLPRFGVQKIWPPGVIPIGNAAAAVEPIGGEGMGLALRSAELAVDAVCHAGGNWSSVDQRNLSAQYQSLWRIRRAACRATAVIVSSTNAIDIALHLMKDHEKLAGLAMHWMGK